MDASSLELVALVREIAQRVGAGDMDPKLEHSRWNLYVRVIESGEVWDLLGKVVEVEPDQNIATSVVLRMVEEVPANERDFWVMKISDSEKRAYVDRRVRDLGILDLLTIDTMGAESVETAPVQWSDWLQRRAAEVSTNRYLLRDLKESGRTKRVRNIASERLRKLKE